MVRTTVLASAAAAAVTTAALAGCGGGDSPKPAPFTPSAAASASASPSGAPTMPAEAQGTSPESAEAFVRYYMAIYSYSARTGDTAPMKRLVTDECRSCSNSIALIDKTYASGGHAEGRGYSVSKLTGKRSGPGSVILEGTVTQYGQQFLASASATPTSFPRGTFRARFELANTEDVWHLNGLFLL
ncbi:hypothetical protein D9V37_09530 [Nocardioides mangrovicus]|uniref:DUF6318 domain-containing protein n=1 Tax=Nocardioides mangrovicus TaxID=2478913 RepID=A0A3L8P071_9ACTN|nr:DUF6318 family protein [Nocardioides mangrovicus]RLV48840.1 hypothetical protein D9V37_09530 [Nocardioides mangrovicus]